MMFYRDKCTGCGKCKEVCPYHLEQCDLCGKCTLYYPVDACKVCGRNYTADEVLAEVIKDKSFYETSGGGVTFSGGECMLQVDFLLELLNELILNNLKRLFDASANIWIHIPIIPDVNNNMEEMRQIKSFLDMCGDTLR